MCGDFGYPQFVISQFLPPHGPVKTEAKTSKVALGLGMSSPGHAIW